MEGVKPHSRSASTSSELFICFTSRASSSSMKVSSAKSILSPGRTDKLRDSSSSSSTLHSSLSRRLRSNGSMKGGHSSPMFPAGTKKKGCAFDNTEPSSPKVTCIGQVRVKTKKQGKKMRSRSKRRGEVSFRRSEERQQQSSEAGAGQQQQQRQQECFPNRNQRWVHFSLSVCEALRAFGSEFNCFLPCRSSCSSAKREKEGVATAAGPPPPNSSCGAVFARWLMELQESEEEKRREVAEEIVGGGAERLAEERLERVVSLKREVSKREEKEIEVEGVEEEEVSICNPPRNALLLMRCRSEPLRMSSFERRFWESPAQRDEEDDEDDGDDIDDDNEGEEVEGLASVEVYQEQERHHNGEEEEEEEKQEDMEKERKKEIFSSETSTSTEDNASPEKDEKNEEHSPQETNANSATAAATEESQEQDPSEKPPSEELTEEEKAPKQEEEQQEREDEQKVEDKEEESRELYPVESSVKASPLEAFEEENLSEEVEKEHSKPVLVDEASDKEERDEDVEEDGIKVHLQGEVIEEEVEREANAERVSDEVCEEREGERSSEESRAVEESREEKSKQVLGAWEETCREGEGERSTKVKVEQERTGDGALPDCLLMMMWEPKLSMEVSKETWVCRTDFLRCRPANAVAGAAPKPSHEEERRRSITDSNPAKDAGTAAAAATVVEHNLAGAAAYGPFVLTRCKSEPMRPSAKLAPEACCWNSRKLPHVGVGAAGIGF